MTKSTRYIKPLFLALAAALAGLFVIAGPAQASAGSSSPAAATAHISIHPMTMTSEVCGANGDPDPWGVMLQDPSYNCFAYGGTGTHNFPSDYYVVSIQTNNNYGCIKFNKDLYQYGCVPFGPCTYFEFSTGSHNTAELQEIQITSWNSNPTCSGVAWNYITWPVALSGYPTVS
ncbi:hypothetical protein KDL01_27575 [Actinospica durhamensis]|uniref:Secreted protein n=1 Tax=Actinospica durhamensis TaxID=1508375 RepID=A0A941ETR2_9ACTN|nr:hypothetical protein [Actinospica durhamensis]MBR7837068.1 hypothetical protein [Actinospica durhamensis]